ncbi:hypothetical protein AOQ84DRAFT_100804 [Glonium stellatum]|uniref:Uncharacterized protein n=1 Tax=Glonium stellatum TaxID=574774 RepID=A0A8E2JPZ8_9PEZI|nr:hypothetical protein AOQ84DRAFT_100804 [Glonium stellatum]
MERVLQAALEAASASRDMSSPGRLLLNPAACWAARDAKLLSCWSCATCVTGLARYILGRIPLFIVYLHTYIPRTALSSSLPPSHPIPSHCPDCRIALVAVAGPRSISPKSVAARWELIGKPMSPAAQRSQNPKHQAAIGQPYLTLRPPRAHTADPLESHPCTPFCYR